MSIVSQDSIQLVHSEVVIQSPKESEFNAIGFNDILQWFDSDPVINIQDVSLIVVFIYCCVCIHGNELIGLSRHTQRTTRLVEIAFI